MQEALRFRQADDQAVNAEAFIDRAKPARRGPAAPRGLPLTFRGLRQASGDQKQRVALARALVSRPRVLAFDEPLGALDALTRISMQRLLERVWHDQEFTAILVTHDVSEAAALADRVLVLENGRIAHDIDVNIPRPRRRGSAELAALEGSILKNLLQGTEDTSDL